MRKFFGFLAIGMFLCAGSASAGPLESGSLSVTIGTLPGLTVPITGGFTASGNNVTATASNAISGTTEFIGITNAPPITRVQALLTGNATGQLVPGAGTASNPLGIQGLANVVAYGGYVTLVAVPLDPLGNPGSAFSVMGDGGTIIQFTGAGWTTGTVTVMAPLTTVAGAAEMDNISTITPMGTNMLDDGAGQITFISPVLIRTNLAGDLPSFVSLTLTFAPEPAVLLQSGAAALGVLGVAALRRRRASR